MRLGFHIGITALLVILCTTVFPFVMYGESLSIPGLGSNLSNIDAAADEYEYVGDNIVARGHVTIRKGNLQLTADKAIVNITSQDLELSGNVVFCDRREIVQVVSIDDFEKMMQDPYIKTEFVKYVMAPTGKQQVQVKVTDNFAYMKCERAAGNLTTGTLQFQNFVLKMGVVYSQGEYAERMFDGSITLKNAKITTCEYLLDGHDHYAVEAKTATMNPRDTNRGVFNYASGQGEHSITAYNSFLQVWGVPVFWMPVLYKPANVSTFGGEIKFGKTSEWGYYVRSSKNFVLLDDPYLNTNVMLDYYSERGVGYGATVDFMTGESSTEAFFYGIYDRNQYNYWNSNNSDDGAQWAEQNVRMKIPNYRYEFKVSNITHLTDTLDFRGQIDLLSDFNFLRDYFSSRYDQDIEPQTFASLENQFDRFTAALNFNIRVNSFFTTVEKLPELRLDFQRQELFAGLYYQGETSLDWLRMRWRSFDYDNPPGSSELSNYDSVRFDSLHMFYYPLKFFNINFIPRAGVRLTAYSKTSEQEVTQDDLDAMFAANLVDNKNAYVFNSYDGNGGSKLRVTGEVGFEANTKFYRAWQNVKNAYFGLDGLRHVFVPYVNYTYAPKPTVSAENIYYFDEIDRLEEQNFFRLGMVNRLQTRKGNGIHEWMSLENYWDFYFRKQDGFSNIGDLGTIFKFNPTNDLTLTSELLLDLAQCDGHDGPTYREGQAVDRAGISNKFIDRWYTYLTYTIAPHWRIYGGFLYSDSYTYRVPYSMGSSLTKMTASSLMTAPERRRQQFNTGIEFPLLFDKDLFGRMDFSYDVEAALIRNMSLALSKKFHCWTVAAAVGMEEKRTGSDLDKKISAYCSFNVTLTAMPGMGLGQKFGVGN